MTQRQATPCTGGHCVSELPQRDRQPLTPTANLESPPSLPCMSENTHRHSMVVWWLAPSPRIKKFPGLKLCRVFCPASEQLQYVLCRSNNTIFEQPTFFWILYILLKFIKYITLFPFRVFIMYAGFAEVVVEFLWILHLFAWDFRLGQS